jgi:hypothetical protein
VGTARSQDPDQIRLSGWSPWNSRIHLPQFENLAKPANETSKPDEAPLEVESAYPNIPITTSSATHTECSIAINPTDSLNMIVEEIDGDYQFTNGVFVTHDGGATWTAASLPRNPSGLYSYGDPWATFDANGVVYVCGLQQNVNTKLRLQIHKSTDGGNTWAFYSNAFDLGNVDTTADEPVIAVDRNVSSPFLNSLYVISASDTYVSGLGGVPVGIRIQSRNSGAAAFGAQNRASQIGLAQVPHFTFGLHGEIYIAYIGVTDIVNLSGGLYLNMSTDGGSSWTLDQLIRTSAYTDTINGFAKQGFPPASRMGPTPRIALDTSNTPHRGWMYVCYALPASADHKSNLDVFCQRSTDGGTTWLSPVRVNDDPISSTNDQLTPCMAINPDGVLGVVFYDRRDDPNNRIVQTYFAISTDGGQTFQNSRITTQGTDPVLCSQFSTMPLADYIALGATHSAFFPVWTDGRGTSGNLEIYTSKILIGASGVSRQEPSTLKLSGYPNPFQAATSIRFSARAGSDIQLGIFDVLGRKVSTLWKGQATGAEQFVEFHGDHLPTGTYTLRLIDGAHTHELQLAHIQ